MGTPGVRPLEGLRLAIIWWHTLDGSDREPTFTGTSAPDRTGQTEMSDGPTPDDFEPRYSEIVNTPKTGVLRRWTKTAARKLRSSADQLHASEPFGTPTANTVRSMKSS
jgi:hypothetical protein